MADADAIADQATTPMGPAEQARPSLELKGLTEADCRWVYHNFANDDAASEEAPSPGAWGMLAACRKDHRSYQLLFQRLAPPTFALDTSQDEEEMLDATGLDSLLRKEFRERAELIEDPNPKCQHCGAFLFTQVGQA